MTIETYLKATYNQDYLIEQFNLETSNIAEIHELISTAFLHDEDAQKNGASIVFNEETFNRVFNSPYGQKDLFIRAIYIPTGKMVGFIGCLERIIGYQKKEYKCAVPSWAAVHWQHQKKGLTNQMGLILREILLNKKYDIAFSFHETNQHGKDASASFARKEQSIHLVNLATIRKFLIRVFNVKKLSTVIKLKGYEKLGIRLLSPPKIKFIRNPLIRQFNLEDSDRLFELMKDHIERNEMSIIHEYDDFLWYLQQPGINCVVHENNEGVIDGFLLAWEFQFAGFGNQIPFGWIDLVHLHRLNNKDAVDLCKYFSKTSKEKGWVGLQTPYIPYFNPSPFQKAKFIFFPKTMKIDAFIKDNYSTLPIPQKLKSFYFDWR